MKKRAKNSENLLNNNNKRIIGANKIEITENLDIKYVYKENYIFIAQ